MFCFNLEYGRSASRASHDRGEYRDRKKSFFQEVFEFVNGLKLEKVLNT